MQICSRLILLWLCALPSPLLSNVFHQIFKNISSLLRHGAKKPLLTLRCLLWKLLGHRRWLTLHVWRCPRLFTLWIVPLSCARWSLCRTWRSCHPDSTRGWSSITATRSIISLHPRQIHSRTLRLFLVLNSSISTDCKSVLGLRNPCFSLPVDPYLLNGGSSLLIGSSPLLILSSLLAKKSNVFQRRRLIIIISIIEVILDDISVPIQIGGLCGCISEIEFVV